jgi:hypothetical protein
MKILKFRGGKTIKIRKMNIKNEIYFLFLVFLYIFAAHKNIKLTENEIIRINRQGINDDSTE